MDWKSTLIAAVVAAFSGFTGAELSAGRNTASISAFQPANEGTLAETINQLLERQISLSPAQKSQVAAINSRYTHDRNGLMANLYMTRAQLGGAFSENMTLSGPTKDSIKQMETIVGDLQTQTITHIVELRDVLTPAQRQIYDQKVVEMLMRDEQ